MNALSVGVKLIGISVRRFVYVMKQRDLSLHLNLLVKI